MNTGLTTSPKKIQATCSKGRILVVDDHAAARESMSDILCSSGHHVDSASSALEGLSRLETESYDVVITDLRMPGMNGLEFIRELERRDAQVQVVMVTAYASVATAVEAMRHGAFDYIEKPFTADQLEDLVNRAMEHGRCLDDRTTLPIRAGENLAMIGSSGPMRALRQRIAQIAPTSETVLIVGESGTGKELVARSIHTASRRSAAALVSLNCPVLSAQLLESELFGHERGAFTGADSARTGRFELADGGTILLDEITEIDLSLQAKLLRVLQERSFERVGSSHTISVDARVIATTNRNLQAEVSAGRFREDLFFRLNVLPLRVPPLRERAEDVPQLAEHFLTQSASRLHKAPCMLRVDAQSLLMEYRWPGNVRELENLITRASVLSTGESISADELRPWLIDAQENGTATESEAPVGLSMQDMERKLIESTLDKFGGHRAKTAEALGIGLRTLSGKLKQWGYAPRTKSFSKTG
jgi:DNA-binding NtrC family response regulator